MMKMLLLLLMKAMLSKQASTHVKINSNTTTKHDIQVITNILSLLYYYYYYYCCCYCYYYFFYYYYY